MPVKYSAFKSDENVSEYFLIVEAEAGLSFAAALSHLQKEYKTILEKETLDAESLLFTRFFLSDISNQKKEFCRSDLFDFAKSGAISIVEQRPLSGAKISLLAHHLKSTRGVLKKQNLETGRGDSHSNALHVRGAHYDLLWAGNFLGKGVFHSFEQTEEIFGAFQRLLGTNQMGLLNSTLRTWIFVRDVDNHYQGMVDSRKRFFEANGLSPATRYIASTGIEAKLMENRSLVTLDALSMGGLQPEQIVRMEALDHLNPTHEYGVTFERGTKVVFGDRSHLYISGTASIDKHGKVLYLNQPQRQAERTLDNIEALLSPHGATLDAMLYLIVYLRDRKRLNSPSIDYLKSTNNLASFS